VSDWASPQSTMTLFGLHGDLHILSLARSKMQSWVRWIGRVRIEPTLVALRGYSEEDIKQPANRDLPVCFGGLREICSAASSNETFGPERPDHKALDRFAGGVVTHGEYQHAWFGAHLQHNMGNEIRRGQDNRLPVWARLVVQ